MLTLALLALIPLSIGDGSGDGSGGAALIVDAGGAEIAASISVPDESSEGASEDDESTCRWEPAVIYGLPVVDIDLVGDGVLRRNHPVFGHRQYGMREVCDGTTGRFAWVDERPPTAGQLTSGLIVEVRRRLPEPVLRTTPDGVVFVNLDTWLGIEPVAPVSASVAADGHHARVTASPTSVRFSWNGGAVTCAPLVPHEGCALLLDARSGSVMVTTRLTWTVSYSTSVGDGRLDPLVTERDTALPVREIQTVSRRCFQRTPAAAIRW